MLHSKPLAIGKLTGTVYDFDDVGDELPRHNHGASDIHISIVARGRVKVICDNWEKDIDTGSVLDWDVGVYHTFIALEPNTRLVNIIKG